MKRIQSRSDLKAKILLTLGHPYIRVDLSDEHIDLAIDTALRNFFKYSPYGSFESHYIYTISAQDITNGYIPVPRNIDAVVEVMPEVERLEGAVGDKLSVVLIAKRLLGSDILAAASFALTMKL